VDPRARIRGTNKHHTSHTYQAFDSGYLDRRCVGRWLAVGAVGPGLLSRKGNAWYCGEKQNLASGGRDGYRGGLSLGEGSGELIQQCASAGLLTGCGPDKMVKDGGCEGAIRLQ
jgi:hypothetical protein